MSLSFTPEHDRASEAASLAGVNQQHTRHQVSRALRDKTDQPSQNRWLERVFTASFSRLVYAQIWEDPVVDLAALEIGPGDNLITIASGGCNLLNYLTASPASITAVDLNAHHLALCRLKIEAMRRLPDAAAIERFLGQARERRNRDLYQRFIRPGLDLHAQRYWEASLPGQAPRLRWFERNLYRQGMLGRFIRAGQFIARRYGISPGELIHLPDRDAQVDWFDHQVAPVFERGAMRWLLAQRPVLFGLGIPPAQAGLLAGDRQSHIADIIASRLRRLACDFPVRQNYFALQAFGLSYAHCEPGSLPLYLQPAHQPSIKAGLDNISLHHHSMTDHLRRLEADSLDAYVLLDAQDWMSDKQLNALWNEIDRTARPGARVIFRTAGEADILPGRVAPAILSHWIYESDRSHALLRQDRSAIYGGFHLYRRKRR